MEEISSKKRTKRPILILPAVLRISFGVLLFVGSATFAGAAWAQPKENRIVRQYPVNRAAIENLQRWVNAGHQTWCRNPQLVAMNALLRVAPELDSEYQLASVPMETEQPGGTKVTYSFHSLDGLTTYRITVRRYPWLRSTAGTMSNAVWVRERSEIITTAAND